MVAAPNRAITKLPMLTAARTKCCARFNDTAAAYPRGFGVHELVHAQAMRSPDRVALEVEGASLTYRELGSCEPMAWRRGSVHRA